LGRKVIPDAVASFLVEEEIKNYFFLTPNAWKEYYIEGWLNARRGSRSERWWLERILRDVQKEIPLPPPEPVVPEKRERFPEHLIQIWMGLHPEIPIDVGKLLDMITPIIFFIMICSVIAGLLKEFRVTERVHTTKQLGDNVEVQISR